MRPRIRLVLPQPVRSEIRPYCYFSQAFVNLMNNMLSYLIIRP